MNPKKPVPPPPPPKAARVEDLIELKGHVTRLETEREVLGKKTLELVSELETERNALAVRVMELEAKFALLKTEFALMPPELGPLLKEALTELLTAKNRIESLEGFLKEALKTGVWNSTIAAGLLKG